MNFFQQNLKEIFNKKTGSLVDHLARKPSFLIGHLVKLSLVVMVMIEVMVVDNDDSFTI